MPTGRTNRQGRVVGNAGANPYAAITGGLFGSSGTTTFGPRSGQNFPESQYDVETRQNLRAQEKFQRQTDFQNQQQQDRFAYGREGRSHELGMQTERFGQAQSMQRYNAALKEHQERLSRGESSNFGEVLNRYQVPAGFSPTGGGGVSDMVLPQRGVGRGPISRRQAMLQRGLKLNPETGTYMTRPQMGAYQGEINQTKTRAAMQAREAAGTGAPRIPVSNFNTQAMGGNIDAEAITRQWGVTSLPANPKYDTPNDAAARAALMKGLNFRNDMTQYQSYVQGIGEKLDKMATEAARPAERMQETAQQTGLDRYGAGDRAADMRGIGGGGYTGGTATPRESANWLGQNLDRQREGMQPDIDEMNRMGRDLLQRTPPPVGYTAPGGQPPASPDQRSAAATAMGATGQAEEYVRTLRAQGVPEEQLYGSVVNKFGGDVATAVPMEVYRPGVQNQAARPAPAAPQAAGGGQPFNPLDPVGNAARMGVGQPAGEMPLPNPRTPRAPMPAGNVPQGFEWIHGPQNMSSAKITGLPSIDARRGRVEPEGVGPVGPAGQEQIPAQPTAATPAQPNAGAPDRVVRPPGGPVQPSGATPAQTPVPPATFEDASIGGKPFTPPSYMDPTDVARAAVASGASPKEVQNILTARFGAQAAAQVPAGESYRGGRVTLPDQSTLYQKRDPSKDIVPGSPEADTALGVSRTPRAGAPASGTAPGYKPSKSEKMLDDRIMRQAVDDEYSGIGSVTQALAREVEAGTLEPSEAATQIAAKVNAIKDVEVRKRVTDRLRGGLTALGADNTPPSEGMVKIEKELRTAIPAGATTAGSTPAKTPATTGGGTPAGEGAPAGEAKPAPQVPLGSPESDKSVLNATTASWNQYKGSSVTSSPSYIRAATSTKAVKNYVGRLSQDLVRSGITADEALERIAGKLVELWKPHLPPHFFEASEGGSTVHGPGAVGPGATYGTITAEQKTAQFMSHLKKVIRPIVIEKFGG